MEKEKNTGKTGKNKDAAKQYSQMYSRLMDYQNEEHTRNQKRIRIGIKLLWIIPLFFLFLLFVTGSNKIIFLVLWIISVFAIAIYLIGVEYKDYRTQKAIQQIRGDDSSEIEGLISLAEASERIGLDVQGARERIESRVEELKL